MKKNNKKSGFTLVEIMIVVAIIGLLAAIAIPTFAKSRQTSRSTACSNNLRMVDQAKEAYAMEANLAEDSIIIDNTVLDPWIAGGATAATTCPASGVVTVGNIGTAATCDGH